MATVTDNTEPKETDKLAFSSKKKEEGTPERVTLFTIDDKPFTVPVKPKKALVMRYLNVARKTGNDLMAAQFLVEELLGEDQWEEFLTWEDLDDEVMGVVINKCVEIALGAYEETKKK